MSRFSRKLALIGIDILATLVAISLAFVIRFSFDATVIPTVYVHSYLRLLPLIVPMRIVVYAAHGLYRQMWSHASVPELLRVVWAATVDSLLTAVVILYLFPPASGFPRSVIMIGWIFQIGLLGSIRLILRLRYEWYAISRATRAAEHPTLIFGAGDAGAMLAKEFAKHPELGCTVVGFIDDDLNKRGYHIAGKPVLGTRAELAAIVEKHGITHMVIATPSANSSVVREVIAAGRHLKLHLKTPPGLFELMGGKVSVSQIRDVQIEDVLGRDEVKVDLEAIAAFLSGETVLVTGAGGSIGSELCRQVAHFGPRQLLLLGHGENSIYEIDLELRKEHPALDIQPIIADIQDEARIRTVFESFRPGVVFHAAAHKHVPLMEQNPEEAVKNNVFGTLNVARAADFYEAKRFVLISSDKAVNPSSVMGATKRAAEYVMQALASNSNTVFVAVRFGNVLGSRGSAVPLFKRQIAAGGPVTVTDPGMIRYFMTIPEAAQLSIQAAAMGTGGEIFVLDMGKPVAIVDLVRDLIRLSGFEPEVDIPIVYTGIRPGEKLIEELLTAEEGTVATRNERIFVARTDSIPIPALQGFLESIREVVATGHASNERIRGIVQDVVMESVKLRGAVGVGD